MPWASSAPAVRAAIVNLLTTALPTVAVYNGQIVTGQQTNAAIIIGYQDPNIATSMAGQLTPEGYLGSPDRETYTISAGIVLNTGADNYLSLIDQAFALLANVGQTLFANNTLNGLVLSMRIGAYALSETVGREATVVVLAFGITVDAYTSN